MANYKIMEFVNTKKKWIYEKHFEQKNKFIEPSFKENDFLKVLGKDYKLNIKNYDKNQLKLDLYEDKILAWVPNKINGKNF